MKKIQLGGHRKGASKPLWALVDDADYGELSKYTWSKHLGDVNVYYARCPNLRLLMHRHIMGVKDLKIQIDHINGDTLDNRRQNLRLSDCRTNRFNRKKNKRSWSKYKGVTYQGNKKHIIAQINKGGVHYFLGIYKTQKEAAIAYNNKAVELFGEFARLNKIT